MSYRTRVIAPRFLALMLAVLTPWVALQAQSNYATPYTFSTWAGVAGGSGAVDAPGDAARFNLPAGTAIDGYGNIYVADSGNHTIRMITPAGDVTTLAGLAGASGTTDGTGSAARFSAPKGLAVDLAGNVFVADSGNRSIRKITSAGVVTTFAGATEGSSGSVDGTGTAARFDRPAAVAVDAGGNIFVTDTYNHTIRKITSGGVVTTVAGSAGAFGSTDGTGVAARFNLPGGIVVSSSGVIYVADTNNHTIRKITFAGVVTTLAGQAGSSDSVNGTGSAARFGNPNGLAIDFMGDIYVAELGLHTIRKVTPAGVVTTAAGNAYSAGATDGPGSSARFNRPSGLSVDFWGDVYVADTDNHTIRKVTWGGDVTTFVGASPGNGSLNGPGNVARFHAPFGVALDGSGNAYIADRDNHIIRKITAAGVVSTIAGAPGSSGTIDGQGSGARFNYPSGIAVDGSGNVYVADTNNSTIRKITTDGTVSTLAGTAGSEWTTDGTGSAARFNRPEGVAVDVLGNVYVADTVNHSIRKITPAGVVTTFAGLSGALGFGTSDGTGSVARFNFPSGLALDTSGNIYVADTSNDTIRKITPAQVVTTLAGNAGSIGSTDGAGSAARFYNPVGVTVDGSNNVYIVESTNRTIRKLTPAGVVTTLAGLPAVIGSSDGTGSAARFNFPRGIAVDGSGNLYIADSSNNTIRKSLPPVVPTFSTQPLSQTIVATYSLTLTALATGNPAPAYQWKLDGVDIVGATDATYTVNIITAANAGTYTVVASNYLTSITSSATVVVDPARTFTTLAGLVGWPGSLDGPGIAAQFYGPHGIAVDSDRNIYVTDVGNSTIRKITWNGVVSTLAGSAGITGSSDGTGSHARFSTRSLGVAVDGSGNVFVADTDNHLIRKITPAGVVSTVAGVAGSSGSNDGTGSFARFNYPYAVAVDGSGNLYVADGENNAIRKITSAGMVTTFAGLAGSSGTTDGAGSTARFYAPSGVAVDLAGNVYVTDTGNGTIRKITPAGLVATLAGLVSTDGSSDGVGSAAQFSGLAGITVDEVGNLYVADMGNNAIRKITVDGVVTTIAGTHANQGSDDGIGHAVKFHWPAGVAVDSAGNLYVADTENYTIRKGVFPAVAPVITTQPMSQTIAGDSSVTFILVASGYPTPTYQWQKSDANINGATNSSYTIPSVVAGDAGNYTVVVTNSAGSATSNVAVLTTFVAAPSDAVVTITVE